MKRVFLIGFILLFVVGCGRITEQSSMEFNIPYEKIELENGLEVIFHIDRSDPVVAVVLAIHVGSAREKKGRTGFAHLFEHLLFLESENLGKGGLDMMSARIGGSGANGFTSRDLTNYFQTVPKDALEKMLWAEADKLGWFINTVTEPVLAKEKQVVKNEKRQSYDNRPYGHTNYVIYKHLYPADHPYNWQVIGSMEDIQNSELEDVKEFYNQWYVPNNATLVISGDFDMKQTKEWVHKYFDELKRGDEIIPFEKQPVRLSQTLRFYHEDNFANLPELTLTWPITELYHPDSYPLNVLSQYLSQGKKSPLNQIVVEKEKLSSQVRLYAGLSEIAGQMQLTVRAFDGIDLDTVMQALQEGFAVFENEGISEKDLEGIKALQEYRFYSSLSNVAGKGFQLAEYNFLAGDPGYISNDLKNMLDVTPDDVMRVYEKYIKQQPYIATSFVPTGQLDLILDGSQQAAVVEEQLDQDVEYTFDPSIIATYEHTPSIIDRSMEPPYGETPEISIPDIWEERLTNGIKVLGIENNEVPLVSFMITIQGGQLTDHLDQGGVANLTSRLMTKGTADKTPEELEDALQQLGASIRIAATKEDIRITGNTLARNYEATIMILEEMLLKPRWDLEEFDLLKKSTVSQIQQQLANPNAIAENVFNALIYGNDHIKSRNILGNESSVLATTIEDLKDYYHHYFTPSNTAFFVVGTIDRDRVKKSLASIEGNWISKEVEIPVYNTPQAPEESAIYFYNVPNAKQSVFRIGYPALAVTDVDYYPALIMNYKLGGGGFASRLMQELRENKGYTYGIGSSFSGTNTAGPFAIYTSVQSKITLEASQLIKQILEEYDDTFSASDLATTKSFLTKSNARAFESARAKLNMLENIYRYGWEYDYIKEREAIVQNMTIEKIKALSTKYADPDKMIWLIVGDKSTQMDRMKQLGYGEPVEVNDLIE